MSANCFSFWGRRPGLRAWTPLARPLTSRDPLGYSPQLNIPGADTKTDIVLRVREILILRIVYTQIYFVSFRLCV